MNFILIYFSSGKTTESITLLLKKIIVSLELKNMKIRYLFDLA